MPYCLRALLLCLVLAKPQRGYARRGPIGAQLRDAALQGLNGPPRHLSSFRGRPLLINVWASWCGPCKQEMASLERLAWQEQDFAIIGISTDDYADKAASLLKGTMPPSVTSLTTICRWKTCSVHRTCPDSVRRRRWADTAENIRREAMGWRRFATAHQRHLSQGSPTSMKTLGPARGRRNAAPDASQTARAPDTRRPPLPSACSAP